MIDVIVPLYNNEKYAIDAINSALAQTYPVRKIIVVDDGSADRSAAILETHFAGNEQVEIVRVEHGGLPWARNRGIERSDAEFIAFLDSDDLWYPDKIERQMPLFAADPDIGLVYCAYDDIDSAGNPLPAPRRLIPHLRGYVHGDILSGNLVSGGSAAVVRRDCLLRAGMFDESLPYGEDWDMWLRLAKLCKFDFVSAPLLAIRRHPAQMSAGSSYLQRFHRLCQYARIWAKWPDEIEDNDGALRIILGNTVRLCLKGGLSPKRWLAVLHVVNRRIVARTHPRLYAAMRGDDIRLMCRLAVRGIKARMQKAGRLRSPSRGDIG